MFLNKILIFNRLLGYLKEHCFHSGFTPEGVERSELSSPTNAG